MKKKLKKYQLGGDPNLPYDPLLNPIGFGKPETPINPNKQQQILIDNSRSEPVKNPLKGARTDASGNVIKSDIIPLDNSNAGRYDANYTHIPYRNVIGDALDKGFTMDGDGKYRKLQITEDKNNLTYNKFFQTLNPLLDITQGIAGTVNDYKNSREEQQKLQRAKYKSMDTGYNSYEKGLNNVPVYFKLGGENEDPKPKAKKPEPTPIVVNNPNDPRLRAYQDSLNLYKAYQMQDKLMGKGSEILKDKLTKYDFSQKQLQEDRKIDPKYGVGKDWQNEKDYRKANKEDSGIWSVRDEDIKLLNYYKSLGFNDNNIMYHQSPDIVNDKIRPIANYFDGTAQSPVYKKPVQPVVYQKEKQLQKVPTITETIPTNTTSNNAPIQMNKLTVPPQQQNRYVVEYTNPETGLPATARFPNEKQGSAFQTLLSGNRTGYYEFAMGGENEKGLQEMQTGGIPERYKVKGFNKVGVKRKSTRPGKKWMVLAKKGDSYKIVHGGDSKMQDYTQHHDKQRRKNFWNRMGTTNDKFSARYWHKKFGTWQEGGEVPLFGTGGKNVVVNGKPMYKRADGKIVKRGLWSNVYLSKKMQEGGEEEQLMQILQMYAEIQNIKPEELIQQIQQVPDDKQQEVMQQIVQTVQEYMQQHKGQNPQEEQQEPMQNSQEEQMEQQMQTGGVPEVEEDDNYEPNAEVEEGEVIQQQNGNIVKAAEGSGTHEEGGNKQPFVFRVLEDTADKRKDKNSKLLRITPNEAELIVGFKPKSAVSHSKLYELALEKQKTDIKSIENKLNKNLDYLKYTKGNMYAQNSLDLNLKFMQQMTTEQDIFNKIFDHQEQVKQKYSIGVNNKMQTGGENGDGIIDPYTGAKTKKGSTTPKGNNNAYNKDKDYLKRWEALIPGISKLDNTNAQKAIYQYSLKNNPDAVKQMWDADGNTALGRRNKNFDQFTTDGVFNPGTLDDKNLLVDLEDAYVDGLFGRRQLEPNIIPPATTTENVTNTTQPTSNVAPLNPQLGNLNKVIPSTFNEPLKWFDIAGATLKYIDATQRIPVELEQLKRDPLKVHEVNPLPTLLQNQGDFNAAIQDLPTNGVGFANQANLMSNKYKVNNEVLGQYENINKGKYDAVDQYNDQAQFALQQANMQLRDQFNNRVLQGKEVQREQKFMALDGLFNKIAQNRRFNKEGQLYLEMTPYFDQNGKFNGNVYDFVPKANGVRDIVHRKTKQVVKTVNSDKLDANGNLKSSTVTTTTK